MIKFHNGQLTMYKDIKFGCNRCTYFLSGRRECDNFKSVVPPEYILDNDCPSWALDDIPF